MLRHLLRILLLLDLLIGWGLFWRWHLPGEPLVWSFIHLRLELLRVAVLLVFHGGDSCGLLLFVVLSAYVYDASSNADQSGFERVIGVVSSISGVMWHSEGIIQKVGTT
jgi:hypothetical protein